MFSVCCLIVNSLLAIHRPCYHPEAEQFINVWLLSLGPMMVTDDNMETLLGMARCIFGDLVKDAYDSNLPAD